MKLYLVEASWCIYGQYDSFVVWAKSPSEALSLARAKSDTTIMNNFSAYVKVIEIKKPKESGIVLGSFNAG